MTYGLNDAMIKTLQGFGYTGTVGDMEHQFLRTLTGYTDPATTQDLWGILCTAAGITGGTTQENMKVFLETRMVNFFAALNDAEVAFWNLRLDWNPQTNLFEGSGYSGGWYDPSTLGSMYQDSAGTIPVTDVNQPVGRLLDRSGYGLDLVQTTSSKRPVLKHDGSYFYLDFNGSDSSLVSESTLDLTAVTGLTICGGWYRDTNSSVDSLVEHGVIGTSAQAIGSYLNTGANTLGSNIRNGGAGPVATVNFSVTTKYVLTTKGDRTGVTSGAQIFNRLNGATPTNTMSGVAMANPTNYGNYNLYVGARNQSTNPLDGRMYQLVVVTHLPITTELASLETFVNSKTGAY